MKKIIYLLCLSFYLNSLSAADIAVIAHRGASGHAPENTISAITKGVELKSHFIEIDVHMSRDGHIIAFHDDKLDRTTNGKGYIKGSTLRELKSLDAGDWFKKKFKGERIPTLKEILELNFDNSGLIIEVKNVNNIYQGIEQKIVDLVKKSSFKNKVIYKSFSTEVLERFRIIDGPESNLLYVTIGPLPIFNWLVIDDSLRIGSLYDLKGVNFIQVHRFLITSGIVKKAHSLGKKIIAWDVHSYEDIKEMKDLNVDFIETDFPERVN